MNDYELWDLNDDEILNNAAAGGILCGFKEEDRNSPQIGMAETEADLVSCKEILCLFTNFGTQGLEDELQRNP